MTGSAAPPVLGHEQTEALRAIAAAMIPACAEPAMPGADDDRIFADIVASTGRDTETLRGILDELVAACDGDLAQLHDAGPGTLLARFRARRPHQAAIIERVVCQCYYRDDRVLATIGMEPRPPFPLGYSIPAGDWSLLDPVRARGRTYREVPGQDAS